MQVSLPRCAAFSALLLSICALGCGEPPQITTYEFESNAAPEFAPLGPYELAESDRQRAESDFGSRSALELFDDVDGEGDEAASGELVAQMVVRVVDVAGAAVAGADVFVFEPVEGEAQLVLHEMGIGLDSQSFLERRGEERAVGADGQVRVALFERDGLVGARAPGLWGSASVRAEQAEVVVVLQPTQELLVRVVGPDGQPRSLVPVALHRQRRGEFRDTRIVHTDADGIATFFHPSELFARGGRDWEWCVTPAIPLFEAPSVVVSTDPLPTEPIELVLPPLASLVVELIEPGGDPFAGSGRLTVAPRGGRRRPAPFESYVAGESRVRVPFVEPGLELHLEFQREGSPGSHRMTAAAPLLPDIETEVRFVLTAEHPVLIARLVDPDDVPIASQRVNFRLMDDVATMQGGGNRRGRDNRRDTGERFTTTDERGRLVVDLPQDWLASSTRLAGTVATLTHPGADDTPPMMGVFEGPPTLVRGVNDIGKVILAPPPVLVGGVVVDELGLPIADVSITLHLRAVDDRGREQWRRLPDLDATTGDDGSFSIAAWSPGTPLALRASTRDHVRADLVPFDPGTKGMIVTLIGAGRIAGRLRVPEGVDARRFDIGVAPSGLVTEREVLARASLTRVSPRRGDGAFELQRVPPGSYTVWIAYTDLPGVHFLATEVFVRSGETTRDPRLDPVDLTGTLRVFQLRFLEPDGDPIGWGNATWRATGEDAWRDLSIERGGIARLVADSAYIDVQAISRGMAPTTFTGISSSGDLTLDPPLSVTVRIDRSLLPDFERYRLTVDLQPQGWGGGRTSAPIDAEGRGTFASAGTGAYTVRFRVQMLGGGRRGERSFTATPPETVVLDGRSGHVEIRPQVPREALAAAIAALR